MPEPTINPIAGMTAEEVAADEAENGAQIEVDVCLSLPIGRG